MLTQQRFQLKAFGQETIKQRRGRIETIGLGSLGHR